MIILSLLILIRIRQGVKLPVPLDRYQKFYDLIASEHSVDEKSHKLESLFVHSHPTLLMAYMNSFNQTTDGNSVFQVIEFIEQDYFQVQVHQQQKQGEWAYFFRKNLYADIMHLFKNGHE